MVSFVFLKHIMTISKYGILLIQQTVEIGTVFPVPY